MCWHMFWGGKKSPVVPGLLAGYWSESAAMLFIPTLRHKETTREAMTCQIPFSVANGNLKYFEAGQQCHRNLTHAVNRSDRNVLTVKLHAAVVQVKTIFFWWSGNTERDMRLKICAWGELVAKSTLVQGHFKCKEVDERKTCLRILCDLIVCT